MKTPQPENDRRHPFPEEAAFLDLLRTTDMLSRGLIAVLKTEDISSTQYNVLRILRGSPEGLPCGEIANRMITRDPDITRLLDRLEDRQLRQRGTAVIEELLVPERDDREHPEAADGVRRRGLRGRSNLENHTA